MSASKDTLFGQLADVYANFLKPSGQGKKSVLKWIGLIVLGIILLNSLVIIVPAGSRVVVFNNFTGVEKRVLTEGINLLVPFVQSPVYYDVRTQTYTMSATVDQGDKRGDDGVSVLTADGQPVKFDISVRYHLLASDVWKVHQDVGPGYIEKIVRPTSRTVIRDVVSGYTVTEVYSSKRAEIQTKIAQELDAAFKKYNVVYDEILIRNIQFSDAFAQAVEQKQIAMQDAQRMKYVLQKEEAEKQRKIIEATGEAEALRKKGEALKANPHLIQYTYVQKLSPNVQAIVTNQSSILNMADFLKKGTVSTKPE